MNSPGSKFLTESGYLRSHWGMSSNKHTWQFTSVPGSGCEAKVRQMMSSSRVVVSMGPKTYSLNKISFQGHCDDGPKLK
jgi:hypothetical protein